MFLPDNIDFAESKKYILSIRLTLSGFYFSVHSPSNQSIFHQKNITFSKNSDYLKNIEKLIFDYSFFSNNFKKVNVICVDERTTIVPNEYFDIKRAHELLAFNCTTPESKIMTNHLSMLNAKLIWCMSESIHSFLSRSLLNPNFQNHLAVLTTMCYKLTIKNTSELFVNFNSDNLIDLIAFSEGKLVLAKTIYVKSSLEESFHIQKTWEALGFDVQSDFITLSGETTNHTQCIDMLQKIIAKTKKISLQLAIDSSIEQEEIPTEIVYQLCEL